MSSWVVRPHNGGCGDLLALHERNPERYPALFESLGGISATSRYHILFAFPGQRLQAGIERDGFFPVFEQARALNSSSESCPLPFCGGWLLYFSYETLWEFEALATPSSPDWGGALPRMFAWFMQAAVVVDQQSGAVNLVAYGKDGEALLAAMAADLEFCWNSNASSGTDSTVVAAEVGEERPEKFLDGVVRAKKYIHEGDVFQVNLSRRWDMTLANSCAPSHIYRQLRRTNPAPFASFVALGNSAIVSSSPERLLQWREGWLDSRPIAGTRPRGMRQAEELIAHPKERAEHVMLIDLIRNDLGRVCRYGSVEVDALMAVETYAHVHHIVSNVRGRPRSGLKPSEAVGALFPGGTITGCPKVRCMEIIAELEGEGRGAYTGSLGYLSVDGQMDLNILIRTLEMHGEHLLLRAGAGIVADSSPTAELAETRAKARGVLRVFDETA